MCAVGSLGVVLTPSGHGTALDCLGPAALPASRGLLAATTFRDDRSALLGFVRKKSQDGFLNSQEFRQLADHTGFSRSEFNDAEWPGEFKNLAESVGCRPELGISLPAS